MRPPRRSVTVDVVPTATGTSPCRPRAAVPPERPDPVIAVHGLVKRYGGLAVVDGVDLRVERGEIFGLLGANGAGKTTTVECLQGLRRPDAGSVRVLGLDPVADRAALRRRIGSQLQDSALPDRLRAGEALRLLDPTGSVDVDAHLGRWGLDGCRRTGYGDLSGGQRQRLLVAIALLGSPEVVFLDELTTGLDAAARRDVWATIRRVRDDGATVVLVSHLADEIEALCDRVGVLRAGRVVDVATPRGLVDRHAPGARLTCVAPSDVDLVALGRLRGVERAERRGDRLVVEGASELVAPVCAALLDADGSGPAELVVERPSLDDALAALTGAGR